jgi:uncharacterized protein (UPF0333 family)
MGVVSLSVILVVLTIAAFALLTYVSANSDYKLSVKAAENVTAYYAAETAANRTLETAATIIGTAGWQDKLADMGCTVSDTTAGYTISFSQPVDAHKTLEVTVRAESDHLLVLRWQTVTAEQ